MNVEQVYSVNPSVGFIEPNGTILLSVKRIATDDDLKDGDTFLIKA